MFDIYDEEARRIVSEFCLRYNLSYKFRPNETLPEPRVWLMAEIAKALKKASKDEDNIS